MDKKPGWKRSDLIIPALSFALAVYYLSTIMGIPFMAQMYGGSLSVIVILLCLLTLVFTIKDGGFKTKFNLVTYVRENWEKKKIINFRNALILLGMTIIYIYSITVLGYTISSIWFLCAVMYFLGMRKILPIIGCAVLVTVIGFVLFILFLKVQLPLDPVSRMVRTAFNSLQLF